MKDRLLGNLHKIIRSDSFIQEIVEMAGISLSELENKAKLLEKEFLFSSMSLERIEALEKEMAFKTNSPSIEGKRLEIEARWKSSGKCDLQLLQTIANTWRNGEVEVSFANGILQIEFISIVGIPDGVENLKFAINEAKPAHLGINFKYRYRFWSNLPPKTWKDYSKFTWKEIMEKEGI